MFSYSCRYLLMTPFVVSSTIFWTVSKVKEKEYFGKKFCNFKALFEWRFTFLIYVKIDYSKFDTVIFFSHTNKKISLSGHGYFFPFSHCPFLIIFFSIKPTYRIFLSVLRNSKFHNRFYMWIIISLKSPTS